MFRTLLSVVPNCNACDLSLENQDSGDGPVFVALVLVGFISVIVAAFVESKWQPEWWVHAAVQIPLVIVTTLLTLRLSKSLLIAYQYKYKIRGFEGE
jgi:uncharacterized protein (DUF983 family)